MSNDRSRALILRTESEDSSTILSNSPSISSLNRLRDTFRRSESISSQISSIISSNNSHANNASATANPNANANESTPKKKKSGVIQCQNVKTRKTTTTDERTKCYETSGLFMESSEGLALPTLSHEPPPSYDAVMVAMQETSHQPSRISPPPDYRSMNDVSGSSGNPNDCNPKFVTSSASSGGGGGNANSLRIKKVLSAQSCCSLQRAEAENLFQLGVAAAAATSGRFGASALGRKSLPYTAHNLAEGRFINHHPYYQGCPLCGKFRYDDSMSLSSDSGLDQVIVTVDVNNANSPVGVDSDTTCYCTPLQSPTIADDSNNNCRGSMHMQHNAITEDDRRRISTPQLTPSAAASHAKYENTINNNDNEEDDTPTTGGGGAGAGDATATAGATSASLSLSPLAPDSLSSQTTTASAIEASTSDNRRRDTDNTHSTDDVILDLDAINDNGIIRLDMSKIIDKTGLPTYEAALKLESSGYV